MSKRIIGNAEIQGTLVTNSATSAKAPVLSVTGNVFDDSGNLEIDAYTEQEINDIIKVLPVSHYGTFNFLPPGVSGSFEGASDVPDYRFRRIHVEDDGTLTILRPGTNGAKRGLYYSYLNNILNTTNLNTAINTNREYKPSYFGNTYTAKMAFASDSKVVAGLALDSSNNQYIFISWANDTLNDSQHVGSIVPASLLMPTSDSDGIKFVMTGNTEIYFFVDVSNNNDLILEVRSVPISQVRNSSTTLTVTEYQNWTNNTFYSQIISNKNIVLNERRFSANISDRPYMLVPSSTTSTDPYMTGIDIYAAQDTNGMVRLRVVGDAWCTTPFRNIRPKHSYSILLNFSNKISTLESGNVAPLTITDPGSGTSLNVSGSTFTTDPILTFDKNRTNMVMAYFYFDNGTTIGIASENLGSMSTKIMRALYPNAKSVYNTLQVRSNTSTNFISGQMNTSYGSPVGSEVMSFEWLPNNRYRVGSFDAKSRYCNSLNEYKPGANYTFGSITYGTIKGFEPTVNRKIIPDIDNKIFISTISGNTVTTNGGIFMDGWRSSTPLSYDKDMNTSGSISISDSLLQTFKSQQLSNTSIAVDLNNKTSLTLFVPQQADCPAFALITGVTPSLTNYYKVVEVNVNARKGVISTLTFKRLVTEGSGTYGNVRPDATFGERSGAVGITIYDAGSFYFIGGVDPYMYLLQGDSDSITWRATVNKSTQQMDSFIVAGVYQSHTANYSQLPWAVPGVGFGYLDFEVQANDDRVRIIFQPVGTTLAQYNAWTPNGNKILLASQDVAQGFIVYFTEETPVIFSGASFTLPITNIDLTTVKANPANSTFHVYVQMIEGLAQYKITEEVLAEAGTSAYNLLWIGTVTTNSIQISSIQIQKRSRLDVFGPSIQPAGSSFPVSSGLPSSTGTIQW